METANQSPGRRRALLCVARLIRAGHGYRTHRLLDATRRLAGLQGLTCIALDLGDRAIFVLAGGDAALDRMIAAMNASQWHEEPLVLGDRVAAPHLGLVRSAVRPPMLAQERRWLEQEVARATPRLATLFALLDWAILRDLEQRLIGAVGPGAPFPALPCERTAMRLQ